MSKISVSRAVQLLQCPLQGWMGIQDKFEWLTVPKSEAQVLGTIGHKLAEEIDDGRFDQISDVELDQAVLDRWNHLVGCVIEELRSQSLFGEPAPPKRWPYFAVKQSAALERARQRRANRGRGGGERRPETEIVLNSDLLQLTGRVDKVEYFGAEVRLVDIKMAENPGGTIPQAYFLQLILYSGLWLERTGKLPRSIAIEWQDGSRSVQSISNSDVDDVCSALVSARIHLHAVDRPRGTPSEEVCRNCDYRVLCPQFLDSVRESWVRQPPFIIGPIKQIIDLTDDRVLVVEPTFSHPSGITTAVVHRFPSSESVAIGDQIIFDRLAWRGGEGNFDARWNSRFRKFRDADPETVVRVQHG